MLAETANKIAIRGSLIQNPWIHCEFAGFRALYNVVHLVRSMYQFARIFANKSKAFVRTNVEFANCFSLLTMDSQDLRILLHHHLGHISRPNREGLYRMADRIHFLMDRIEPPKSDENLQPS